MSFRPNRLPNGYTELAWIESSGTQYINTGILGKDTIEFELFVQMRSSTVGYCMGAMTDGTNRLSINNYNSGEFYHYGTSTTFSFSSTTLQIISYKGTVFSYGGNTKSVSKQTYTVNSNIYLFTSSSSNQPHSQFGTFRMGYCKLWDNGTLVRDLVPCISPTNEVGMYDLVSQQFFGNAGTGEFIAGDVQEYRQLTYLQSSDTQHIDTEVNSSNLGNNFELYTQFSFVNFNKNYATISGSQGTGHIALGNIQLQKSTSQLAILSRGDDTASPLYYNNVQTNTIYVVSSKFNSGNAEAIVNGELKTGTFSIPTNTSNLFLFKQSNASGAPISDTEASAKLYYYKIVASGVLIRDFIPAISADETLGLFDKITQRLFTNQGTGTFIGGKVVDAEILVHPISATYQIDETPTALMTKYKANVEPFVFWQKSDDGVNWKSMYPQLVNYQMLYYLGDECTDVTGGWDKQTYISLTGSYSYLNTAIALTKQSNSMSLVWDTSTGARMGIVGTSNKINPSLYEKAYFRYKATSGVSNYKFCDYTIGNSQAGVSPCYSRIISNGSILIQDHTEIDISSLTESSYVHIAFTNTNALSGQIGTEIYGIWLAKADNLYGLSSYGTDIATILTNSTSLLSDAEAVNYITHLCTGDFMASAISNATFMSAYQTSPYKYVIDSNEHWSKFLALV